MKIYVDFDKTLFDRDKFLEDFYCLIEKCGISRDKFNEYQNQFKNFNPRGVLDLIDKEEGIDKHVYSKVEKLIGSSSKYLFSDTIPFLKYLKNKKYPVIILTKGDYNFQMSKIVNSHINEYYDEIMITDKHKGELDIDYANGIFIDDRIAEIKSIMANNPMRIISIQRNGIINSEVDVETVNSLNELINNI